jgi:hypothetical protein
MMSAACSTRRHHRMQGGRWEVAVERNATRRLEADRDMELAAAGGAPAATDPNPNGASPGSAATPDDG